MPFDRWDAPKIDRVPDMRVQRDGTRIYRYNGALHRADGPAVEGKGEPQWHINGFRLDSEDAFLLALSEALPPVSANKLARIPKPEREDVLAWRGTMPDSFFHNMIF